MWPDFKTKMLIALMMLVLFGVAYCVVRFQDQRYDRFDDTSAAWCCLMHGVISRPRKYDGFDDTHFFVVSLAVWAQHDRFDDTRVVWCCLRRGQISKQNNMMDLTVLVLFGVAYCVASFQNKNHDRFDGVWC